MLQILGVCVCVLFFSDLSHSTDHFYCMVSYSSFFPQMKPNDVYFRNIGLLEFYGQPCPRRVILAVDWFVFFSLHFLYVLMAHVIILYEHASVTEQLASAHSLHSNPGWKN